VVTVRKFDATIARKFMVVVAVRRLMEGLLPLLPFTIYLFFNEPEWIQLGQN